MEDEAMKLEWAGPKNEKHLDECLGGAGDFNHYNCEMENQFYSLMNMNDDAATEDEQTVTDDDLDLKDYLDPSMLGCFLPNGSSGSGRRGPRRTGRSATVELIHNFVMQEPSASGGSKYSGRKNNDHWTQDEVRKLVNGVSEFGVGKWRDVKEKYFSTSIRTPAHLKDKWKNLVKACKKEAVTMLVPLEESLIERIREIDAADPYPKPSSSAAPPPPTARWSGMKTRSNNKRGSSTQFLRSSPTA